MCTLFSFLYNVQLYHLFTSFIVTMKTAVVAQRREKHGSFNMKYTKPTMNCTPCYKNDSHLYIRCVSLTVSPGAGNGREGAVRMVKFVFIGIEEKRREGLLQRKKNKHNITRDQTKSFPLFKNHYYFYFLRS